MVSTIGENSQNDYINNMFKQELFSNKKVNVTNLDQILTTLQDTSTSLGQSLQVNVKSQLSSFFSIHEKNTQVYEHGRKYIQEALSSSHDILLQDAKITPKSITSHFLTTQSKFQHCKETIISLQCLIDISQQLDNVYTIITSKQQSKLVEAIEHIFSILKQINSIEENEHIIAWQSLKQKAIQYRQWVTSLVHDGLSECIVYSNGHFDNSHTNDSNVYQSSITIFSCTKLNDTAFHLFDLLHATILLDIQHSELASIQRQLVKYFIDPFLSVQRTSGSSIQLAVDKQDKSGCIKRTLYINKCSSNSNSDEINLTKNHHDRCADAEKMLQDTDLILQFIFSGIFNNTENSSSQSSLEPLRQLFGHLLLPHVLDTLVSKAMIPTISLSSNSLSDISIALNDLDALTKLATNFEKQWIIDYAHFDSGDCTDLPLGKYVNHFDQHVAYQRRSVFLNEARKIMLRKVYDAEEYGDVGKITQTPKVLLTMVQQMLQEIQLFSTGLDKYPETAATLRKTIQEVIMLYITIMPSYHRHLFLQHTSHAMIFHNDCYWLADSIANLEFQDNNETVLMILRRLGDTWKRIIIAQFMTKVDIILNKTEEWRYSALPADLHFQQQQEHNKEVISFENAVEMIVNYANTFIADIKDVVINRQCKAILISITNGILKKIIDGILSMGDIAADTSRTMAQGLNGLAQLATLFSKVIDSEESVSEVTLRQWVPNWQPFWVLKDMLDMTMADILDALYRGDLSGFTHDQLTHLVCSLFSDTPRRDETVRIINCSDLGGAPQKSISSLMSNSQVSQSKRSISFTNPHNEQLTKRSFLERLLIPEDEIQQQQQQHSINNKPTSDSSKDFKLGDQYKDINSSRYKFDTLPPFNQTPNILQQELSNDRFSFKESVNNDEWNQSGSWSDDDDDDDVDGGNSKSIVDDNDKDNKLTSKNISTFSISEQKNDNQYDNSDEFNYNENLVGTNNEWNGSDALELLLNNHGFKREIEQETEDSRNNNGALGSNQKSTINSKFCFNEVLNTENDGWDQYEPLEVVNDQFGNDQSTDLVPTETEAFSHNQLLTIDNRFEYNETLDENAWSGSESLNMDIDITNNENNARLPEYETASSIDKQLKINTHINDSENYDHEVNESNQLPSSFEVQTNLQEDMSVDSNRAMDSIDSDNHYVTETVDLIIDEKNKDTLPNIQHEELFEKLTNDEQQQQFDNSSKLIFNNSLHHEDSWDETEPFYTDIENSHVNSHSKQQDQGNGDDDDDIIKVNDIDNNECQLDLLDIAMDRNERSDKVSSIHGSTHMEKQIVKYDGVDSNENYQDDHDMDLLEQGLYGPSQMHNLHLSSFDDISNLDNKINELEQLESPDKNIATDDKIQDIESDSLEQTNRNINLENGNERVDMVEPVFNITIIDNSKNNELYKMGSKTENDNSYIVNDGLDLSKLEQVTENKVEDNLKYLTEEITNRSDNGEDNIVLNRIELTTIATTNDDNDSSDSIVLNQLVPVENIDVYDNIESTKQEQLEQGNKCITMADSDEDTMSGKLEPIAEMNFTENIGHSTSNQLQSIADANITNDCNISSQLILKDKNGNNTIIEVDENISQLDAGLVNDNEGSAELDSRPMDDNQKSNELYGKPAYDNKNNIKPDNELMGKLLPKSDNMVESEQVQKSLVNNYDNSELAVNVNENVHIQYSVDQVTNDPSTKSEGISNDKPVESLLLGASVNNDYQIDRNDESICNNTSLEEILKRKSELVKDVNERCNNPNSILLVDDIESKNKIDSLKDIKETFASASVNSNPNLLDASTSDEPGIDQGKIGVLPINKQGINKYNMGSDSLSNSAKYSQSELSEMGIIDSTEQSKDNISKYSALDDRYFTQHRKDEQLIKSEQLQQPCLSNKFVFDDALFDDGWDQDDSDLKLKLDEMDQASLRKEDSYIPNTQSKSDVKLINENFIANKLENIYSTSEEMTPSHTSILLKQQQKLENNSTKSRFSFDNNLVDDDDNEEAGWDEDNIDYFVSNNIIGTSNKNVIKQTKSDLLHQQSGLSSKFEFNDTEIDDDGWDQEETLGAILNSTNVSAISYKQPYVESHQMKEQQHHILTDKRMLDEPLNMANNNGSIEEKEKINQIESADNNNNELSHSKLLYHKIKNEISEGMSTKLEQIEPNTSQQLQLEYQPSIASDRFTFDDFSDDSGWDQDSGWLDDDDNFNSTISKNVGSPLQQNMQPNQISTKKHKQYDGSIESETDKKQQDMTKATVSNPSFISSNTFAFNDDEDPIGWSDADEDIF